MIKNKKSMMPKHSIPITHSEFHPVSPNEIKSSIPQSVNPFQIDSNPTKDLFYNPPMEEIKSKEDKEESFHRLEDRFSDSAPYCNVNGYVVNPVGGINPITFEDDLKGIICAKTFISNENPYHTEFDSINTLVVNTENGNFRHISIDDNGNMIDLGHVNHACIFGNVERPDGLYIPLNQYAINDGVCMLNRFMQEITVELNKGKILEENNHCTNGDCDNHRECSCNGNCKSNYEPSIKEQRSLPSNIRKYLKTKECNDTLSVDEVCIILGIEPKTVYNMLNSGEIKGYKVGNGQWRFPMNQFLESIENI